MSIHPAEQRASKRRKLEGHSQLASKSTRESPPLPRDDVPAGARTWNTEQIYEQKSRFLRTQPKTSLRLPIKTASGVVAHVETADQCEADVETKSVDENEASESAEEQIPKPHEVEIPMRLQVMQAKEELARVAGQIVEDPEEHIGGLRTLSRISDSKNLNIRQIGLATQMTVFRDIIPGYRIRPRTETESGEKVSKEIRKLQNFEQSLLSAYETYVKELSSCALKRGALSSEGGTGIELVAINCTCTLLVAAPHFNFRTDLIKILIETLGRRTRGAEFDKCLGTLADLFRNDDDGKPSLEAVSMLSKMIKAKGYQINESILTLLLNLRLLSEFSSKGSKDMVDHHQQGDSDLTTKLSGKKRHFRTKKQRKLLKENRKVEKEFKEADAIVGREHRDQMQAETLKVVFSMYFKILKTEERKLIGPVLEGLAAFTHLINQDFFGDLLELLKDLTRGFELELVDLDPVRLGAHTTLHENLRLILLCVRTAFALLEGQDAAKSSSLLGLDLTFFINTLFKYLHAIALDVDLESSRQSLRSDGSDQSGADFKDSSKPPMEFRVNVQTTSALLLRAMFVALRPRSTPPARLAAFTKRICTAALHLPEKSTIASMGLLSSISKTQAQKIVALWNTEERKGDGKYDPLRLDIEGCNPFAATIWEGELLKHHFSPGVSTAAKTVAKDIQRSA